MIRFCSLFSGSSGNCIFVSTGNTNILVDSGLSAKAVVEALGCIGVKPQEIDIILVSHEHSDHTRGVGVLSRKFDIPVYANEITWQNMQAEIGHMELRNRVFFNTGIEFAVKDFLIVPFQIPHDAGEPVGFSFHAGDRKVTVATDIGHINDEIMENLKGSNVLMIEANHDVEMLRCGRYPWFLKKRILGDHGHLSNDAAAEAVTQMVKRGTTKVLLGHLSRENNFPELAYRTVYNVLSENGISVGKDVLLDVARRDRVSGIIEA